MSIDHLDFDTPDVPQLPMDAYGIPLPVGAGALWWDGIFTNVNNKADDDGWDGPPMLFGVFTPLATAGILDEMGGSVDTLREMVAETGNPAEVVTAYSVEFMGNPETGGGGNLWGEVAPAELGALLLCQEAWVTPEADVEVPRKARRGDDGRVEARMWLVATRGGETYSRTYVRTGKRHSRPWPDADDTTGGLLVSVLHRIVGNTVAPSDAGPVTVEQALAVQAATNTLRDLAAGGPSSTLMPEQLVAANILIRGSALGLDVTDDEHAQFTTPDGALAGAAALLPGILARTTFPDWVQATVNDVRSPLLMDPMPRRADHARWAGNDLLASIAGLLIAYLSEEMRGYAAQVTPAQRDQVRAAVTQFGLPVPDGL